jgi:hypothetical protein
MALLSPTRRRTACVLTLVFCEFHTLGGAAFHAIATDFPELRAAVDAVAAVRHKESRKLNVQADAVAKLLCTSPFASPKRATNRAIHPAQAPEQAPSQAQPVATGRGRRAPPSRQRTSNVLNVAAAESHTILG